MLTLKSAFGIALIVASAACYEATPSTSSAGGGYGGSYGDDSDASDDAGPQPTLAFVDANRTLNAVAGQGVGVFVTYQSGGQWLVQWTCDTAVTNESCFFQIDVRAVTGSPVVLASDSIAPGGTVGPSSPGTIQISTTTTTEEDQASFVTSAGATLSVAVLLNGQGSGQYFFFVQNGKVNGGYQGALADPLEFEPTSP